MPKQKHLPPSKVMPEVIEERLADDGYTIITVFTEYTPDMGRKPTSQGGWGRFSGVGNKYATVKGSGGDMVG